jgi:hypothetical protein
MREHTRSKAEEYADQKVGMPQRRQRLLLVCCGSHLNDEECLNCWNDSFQAPAAACAESEIICAIGVQLTVTSKNCAASFPMVDMYVYAVWPVAELK